MRPAQVQALVKIVQAKPVQGQMNNQLERAGQCHFLGPPHYVLLGTVIEIAVRGSPQDIRQRARR